LRNFFSLTPETHMQPTRRRVRNALACGALILPAMNAMAQHAADNPVTAADDAFGLTLGLESIGMYSPGQVRGFSPRTAGNLRIEGLYFDQQGSLSNRVIEGSAIRVGVAETGYAFPAPTGIVDYTLRRPADDTPRATLIVTAGPYGGRGLSLDTSIPVIGRALVLPAGASYQVSSQTPYGAYPGYTSTVTSLGMTPKWSPTDAITVRLLLDWQQTRGARTFPLYYTAGAYQPPTITRSYLGQDWAEARKLTENSGALATWKLNQTWSIAAGLFHSAAHNPQTFADLYTAIQPDGRSEHIVIGYPNQSLASTSGELRLTSHFGRGEWRHEFIMRARGRDGLARYGGGDVVDVGESTIGVNVQVPEPNFTYLKRTLDRTEQWTIGGAYRTDWHGRVELQVGIQEENYRKAVTISGAAQTTVTDHPLRAYGNSAVVLTQKLSLFAGYTQGIEDSGVAPSIARNDGAVLPASRTWQVDSGVRFLVTQHLKIIAGAFELQKPYFNLDASGLDRELGVQQARGIEVSVAGQLLPHLDLNAGLLCGSVRIIGANLAAEGVGPIAVGQPRLQYVANANYTLPFWPALSLDLSATHFGSAPESVHNDIYTPAVTELNLGARLRFSILGKPSNLRLQIQNLSNSYRWTNAYTPGFFEWAGPRTVFAYLTADL
jgi:iron complex outermembrane recepter protein